MVRVKSALKYPYSPKKDCHVTWRPRSPTSYRGGGEGEGEGRGEEDIGRVGLRPRVAERTVLMWRAAPAHGDAKTRKVKGVLQASLVRADPDGERLLTQLELIDARGARLICMKIDRAHRRIEHIDAPGVAARVGEGRDMLHLAWNELGSVWWCQDEEMREPGAHGFEVDWLVRRKSSACSLRS